MDSRAASASAGFCEYSWAAGKPCSWETLHRIMERNSPWNPPPLSQIVQPWPQWRRSSHCLCPLGGSFQLYWTGGSLSPACFLLQTPSISWSCLPLVNSLRRSSAKERIYKSLNIPYTVHALQNSINHREFRNHLKNFVSEKGFEL